jgi:hypothetical protein
LPKNVQVDMDQDTMLGHPLQIANAGGSINLEESDSSSSGQSEHDGPNVFAMRRKQAAKLKQKALRLAGRRYKNGDKLDEKGSKSRERKEIIKVVPYGLANLQLFMEKKIDNLRRVSQSS